MKPEPEKTDDDGFAFTTIDLLVVVAPQEPPEVVNVSKIGVPELVAAVNVAVDGVDPVLLLNVPLGADQTAEVAPPPNVPPSAADVPPWQIAAIAAPAPVVGVGLTVIVLLVVVVPHEPPEVVNVNVIVAAEFAAAVNVVVDGVDPVLLLNVPLGADQTADVAPPPKLPPSAVEVPPWQIAAIAAPAEMVGFGFTVIVLLVVVVPHDPPEVVNVNVMVAAEFAAAV